MYWSERAPTSKEPKGARVVHGILMYRILMYRILMYRILMYGIRFDNSIVIK